MALPQTAGCCVAAHTIRGQEGRPVHAEIELHPKPGHSSNSPRELAINISWSNGIPLTVRFHAVFNSIPPSIFEVRPVKDDQVWTSLGNWITEKNMVVLPLVPEDDRVQLRVR